jgi:hypothetical protein
MLSLVLTLAVVATPRVTFAQSPTPEAIDAVCSSIAGDEEHELCVTCVRTDPPGVWTAMGCIPTTPEGFLQKFLTIGVGMGGGIAFLLILFGAFQILTSTGNPEKLNEGKELVGAAISGLLLIIFSLFILRVIGFDILRIPGFGA